MWDTEQENPTPEYKPRVHLVLEGSDKHEWGVVKDCHGCVNYIPEDAEIVGTWSKYSEGVFWVSLETSLQALQDRGVLLIAELAKKRAEEMAKQPVKARRKQEPQQPSVFDSLRTQIRGDGL